MDFLPRIVQVTQKIKIRGSSLFKYVKLVKFNAKYCIAIFVAMETALPW